MEAYRATLLWNKLFPQESIQDFSNISILPFKINNLDEIISKNLLPSNITDQMYDLLEEHSKIDTNDKGEEVQVGLPNYGFSAIAIPKSKTHFPDIFTNIIDKEGISEKIVRNGNVLLESIGLTVVKYKTEIASNIIRI